MCEEYQGWENYSADAIPEVLAAAYDLTRELLLAALAELAQEMESDPEEMDSYGGSSIRHSDRPPGRWVG